MKKIKNKNEIHPYSKESIDNKLIIIYIMTITLKILTYTPFIYLIIKDIFIDNLSLLVNTSTILINIGCLSSSIIISLISTKKESIENPLFLDDDIVISNKQKKNGIYENVYLDKFKILIGVNFICIIPLCFIISLTISSIICFIFYLLPSISFLNSVVKYFLTLFLLNLLVKTFNEPLIKYLRDKQN